MCWLFHKWGKWFIFQEGDIITEGGSPVGYYVIQKRRCRRCDWAQLRKFKSL